MTVTITNHDRAVRVRKSLTRYVIAKDGKLDPEEPLETDIVDFLSDLMHCAEGEGIDFEACIETAKKHYRAERRAEANPFNMECPQCGECGEIDIQAAVWVRLCPDGTDGDAAASGEHQWDGNSPANCDHCGHAGTVETFTAGGNS